MKALITGGSGEIGQAICCKLAENGYSVYIGYANSRENAENLAEKIGGTTIKLDVTKICDISTAVEKVGGIDLLVNNAGISEIELFNCISAQKGSRIIEINLTGAMNCTRAFISGMINRKSGCIVNISSMWGQVGASCEVDYSASKAGLIGFTKALAKEVAPSGIRVNCVAPGFIMTKMNSHFSVEDLDLIREEIPLGIFGEPRHVADAVAFLASNQAEYITGQVPAVNGGMVI